MRISTAVFCTSLVASPLFAQSVPQSSEPDLSEQRQIENTWILRFSPSMSAADVPGRAKGLASRFGGEVVHEYTTVLRGAALRMNDAAIARLFQADDTGVIAAERDQIASLSKRPAWAGGGDDTETSTGCTQDVGWGTTRVVGMLPNSDNNLNDSCISNKKVVSIGEYGDVTGPVGSTAISVCVADTGVDLDHPDLNVSTGEHFSVFQSGRDSGPDDKNGHGTHVSGTIGALNNDYGVLGVAPGATITAVKVLNSRGSGSVSGVIAGVDWAAAKGCDVLNMSLTTPSSGALNDAVTSAATVHGVNVVVSAGNNADDAVNYSPASAAGAVTIAASTSTDGWASFSNFGQLVNYIMPGAGILSTFKDGGYATANGTSMAAPHMAGVLVRNLAGGGTLESDAVITDLDGAPYNLLVDTSSSAPGTGS